MNIASRIAMIRERAAAAALRAGRDPQEVRLMAVSKFQSRQRIDEALSCGIGLLGESRVQEIREKFPPAAPQAAPAAPQAAPFAGAKPPAVAPMSARQPAAAPMAAKPLPPGVSLHLIGNLQRNKVRQVLPLVDCIGAVDRDELILELSRECERQNRSIDLFLELKTAEDSKAGYTDFDALSRAVELALLSNRLSIRGLMTMAPLCAPEGAPEGAHRGGDEAAIRLSFRSLAAARELIARRFPALGPLDLSMGMSGDFEIAIEEGATIIRVGTLLFEGAQT